MHKFYINTNSLSRCQGSSINMVGPVVSTFTIMDDAFNKGKVDYSKEQPSQSSYCYGRYLITGNGKTENMCVLGDQVKNKGVVAVERGTSGQGSALVVCSRSPTVMYIPLR